MNIAGVDFFDFPHDPLPYSNYKKTPIFENVSNVDFSGFSDRFRCVESINAKESTQIKKLAEI